MAREQIAIAAYRDRGIESVRKRGKTGKTQGYYASTIREQRYVSEPTETKYLKF
jgi:hypothetical protein